MTTTTRARFTSESENQATAAWDDPLMGERVDVEYWAPRDGGYVREVTSARPGTLGLQVCRALAGTGDTLSWEPRMGPLVNLIRREYRVMRRAEAR